MTDEARETFGFPIEVDLTDEEKLENLDRIANIDRKMLAIEGEKAAASARFNDELKGLRKERLTRLEQDTAGKCKMEVECYHERDDRRGIMLTMRCDNGHIVDERALTADERGAADDERQGELFDGGARPSADAGADDEDEPAGDADSEAALDEYLAQSSGGGDEAADPRAH